MQRISEVRDRELIWAQTGYCTPQYELRTAGEEVVATLRWGRGSLAVAETEEDRWSFGRPGLGRSRVNVREAGLGTDIAAYNSRWTGGGTLEMTWGGRFHWSAANLWRSRWGWRRSDGTPLARFGMGQGLVKIEGRVEIERAATALPELDLLVALGWYLMVMRARDGTSDAVAATAGTAGS